MNRIDVFNFAKCECKEKYSIEEYGDGYALFQGKCSHKSGYHLANLIDVNWGKLAVMLSKLNRDGENN